MSYFGIQAHVKNEIFVFELKKIKFFRHDSFVFDSLTDTSENEPKCAVNFRLGAESYSMTHTRRSDAVEIRVDTLAQIRLSTSFESSLVSVKVIYVKNYKISDVKIFSYSPHAYSTAILRLRPGSYMLAI